MNEFSIRLTDKGWRLHRSEEAHPDAMHSPTLAEAILAATKAVELSGHPAVLRIFNEESVLHSITCVPRTGKGL